MKILNLYACLGGNRYKWDEVEDVEVTAVELDPYAAELYQERFPNDTVIVADAHQYLLDHYKEFDFIWSSPPCPSHSKVRITQKSRDNFKAVYPDMKLWQEIFFLQSHALGFYLVENVIPYYNNPIPAQKVGRHLYWTNLNLKGVTPRKVKIGAGTDEVKKLCKFHDYDFYKYKGEQRRDKMARNLVDYEVGKQILEIAVGKFKQDNQKQGLLF